MMTAIAMPERIKAHGKCQQQKRQFKGQTFQKTGTYQWQAGNDQWHQRTMYGAGHRCGDTQGFPVNSEIHSDRKYTPFATKLQI